jgi:peptidoglycan/LPS O-acetylase OafA/YrhL
VTVNHLAQSANHLWMIDLLKVLAAQVIVWHHFCRYGPLATTIDSVGGHWVAFVGNHGRHAVQIFLVISGFIAARTIRTFLSNTSTADLAKSVTRTWFARIWRLGKPYWLMLLVAIVFAALARQVQPDIDTPARPSWSQVLAHVLFFQDVFAMDALSTGVWYVAIDLQLSLLFLLVVFLCSALTAKAGQVNPDKAERAIEGVVWLLSLTAIFVFNRWPSLDIWAIYFFGPFGLGVATGLRSIQARKYTLTFWALVLGVYTIAMAIEWRFGLLLALICAGLLWSFIDLPKALPRWSPVWLRWLRQLSGDSYALFLFHYPVVLLLGTIVNRYWPTQVNPAMLGLLASWAVSMMVAFIVSRLFRTRKRLQKSI